MPIAVNINPAKMGRANDMMKPLSSAANKRRDSFKTIRPSATIGFVKENNDGIEGRTITSKVFGVIQLLNISARAHGSDLVDIQGHYS